MALIEYDVYKQKLRDLEPELKKLGDALDIDAVAQEAARLEDETTQDGFWNNLERSQKVQTRLKQLQNKLHRFKKLMSTWEDLTTLCEMGQEAEDEEILEELKTEFPALETEIEEIRMTTLLSGEYDANNVILQLHSGAGGTEAQDWCQMLYRMYTRWAERHGYAWKTLDYEECDEAGIKSAVISIEGENAYGSTCAHGDHQALEGERQTHGVEGVLTEPGDKHAVHDVVQRLYQHGDHHGHRHTGQQLAYRQNAHLVFLGSRTRGVLLTHKLDWFLSYQLSEERRGLSAAPFLAFTFSARRWLTASGRHSGNRPSRRPSHCRSGWFRSRCGCPLPTDKA